MKDFYGTYRGFMFSDESAVGQGELQIVIDDQRFTVSIATGLGIEEQAMDMAQARTMSNAEVALLFVDDFDSSDARGICFEDGTLLVCVENDGETLGILGGKPGYEMFGPTATLKSLGDDSKYEEAVKRLEDDFGQPGIVPRLSTQGRAPRDFRQNS